MSKFIKHINSAYKSVLTEQMPNYGDPAVGPMGNAAAMQLPPMPPTPPMPGGSSTPQELPVDTPATRSSSDAFLIGLVAKALLLDLDSDDRLRVIKYLKGLDEDSASSIEENLVNMMNTYDYQNIDTEMSDIEIPSKKSRKVLKFIEKIMNDYVDTETFESEKTNKRSKKQSKGNTD